MTIAEYLDHKLRDGARVREMEALANLVAARPSGEVLDELQLLLAGRPLSGEDTQRLQVLLSQLYHRHAEVDSATDAHWRGEVAKARELSRTRVHLLDTREE
jgi:hypothetical protein